MLLFGQSRYRETQLMFWPYKTTVLHATQTRTNPSYSIADVDGFPTCSFDASALRTPPLVQQRACSNKFVLEAHFLLAFFNLWEQISDQCLKLCPIATSSSVHRDIHRSDPTATEYHHCHHCSKKQFEWGIEKSDGFSKETDEKPNQCPVQHLSLLSHHMPGTCMYLLLHL